MNKKGFTLIELLACIIILAMITLVAYPAIMNFIDSSSEKIDEAKKTVIIAAAKDYVNDNVNNYKKSDIDSSGKNIFVSELINNGYITNDDIVSSDEYNSTCVNVKVNSSNSYVFEFKLNC